MKSQMPLEITIKFPSGKELEYRYRLFVSPNLRRPGRFAQFSS